MSRGTLKFLAVLLSVLIVCVLVAGLDNLPRGVRAQIDSERAALKAAQTQVQAARADVARDLESEAALYAAVPATREWPGAMSKAAGEMASAGQRMTELDALEKANRRTDRERAETLLAQERGLRTEGAFEAAAIQKGAAHWIDLEAAPARRSRGWSGITTRFTRSTWRRLRRPSSAPRPTGRKRSPTWMRA